MRAEAAVSTTSVSTKGQIVVPEAIRKSMHIESGDQFTVYAHGETLLLERVSKPSLAQFQTMLTRAQVSARKAGLKRGDIPAIVKQVRKESRNRD